MLPFGTLCDPQAPHQIDPLLLTNTVCQIHPSKTFKVQVLNLCQAPVTLQACRIVCICEELEEEMAGVY